MKPAQATWSFITGMFDGILIPLQQYSTFLYDTDFCFHMFTLHDLIVFYHLGSSVFLLSQILVLFYFI